jgi:tRNA dimethylallyltransferase
MPHAPAAPPPLRPVLIAGPTASGKSALAGALAQRFGGVIVNADSQQVYREWRVLTARPSAEEEAALPHRLYGHVGVEEPYSVGRWLDEVRLVLAGEGDPHSPKPPPHPSPTRGKGAPAPGTVLHQGNTLRYEHAAHAPASGGSNAPKERDDPDAGLPSPLAGEGQGGGPPREDQERGLRPIIVGGTGLYLKALTQGLAPIPEVPAAIRAAGEAELAQAGLARFAERLAARDPETAAALDLANPRRVLRAWEVLEATGMSLATWQRRTPAPLLPLHACTAIALDPPRAWLHARCDARLDAMLAGGALDEVARVMELPLPPDAPGLKAVGAAELARHLAGSLTLDEAAARAKTATRRYAKRQLTWMRNQMPAWARIDPAEPGATERALTWIAG